MDPNDVRLSKTLAFILRHHPHYYELELDDDGWIDLDLLIAAIQIENKHFSHVSRADIERIIATSDKQRYEIVDDRIRAMYGHSVDLNFAYRATKPPPVLYHGTSGAALKIILTEGLKPMSRKFVHLSADAATARMVGQRKGGRLVILYVAATQAHTDGIAFYARNDDVWLADHVPAQYLTPGYPGVDE